ncbi:MAG TPA: phospholipase D-like domain-containing protein [Gaiellaceae bacterium]|jgi:phosphatidylserine/phosphatidylglycerophosphate/cardiolipin synthase-like enzyme|nr:phospholipase D-like domain-containing protein [Gaiellaceae bacterium]
MKPFLTIRTLTDGGQPASEVGALIAGFLDGAERTLDLAQYDFDLGPATSAVIGDAIRRAAARGVRVRLAYNVDHANPVPVPPPPSPDETLIDSLPIEAFAIAGVPDLMHHKYVVRDNAAVWTGSLNWTDDAWTRQENVIVIADSTALAAEFRRDFTQLIDSGTSVGTGHVDPTWHDGVRAWFTPAHGEALSHRVGQAIGRAQRRVRVCSPVLTTPPVLGALAGAVVGGRVDVGGCVDGTQMRDVARQWRSGKGGWKVPLLQRVAGAFTAKLSTPYGAGNVHDFMHAKVTICDDTVFAGSFNLSRSGERNAENVLEIEDAEIADGLAAFVDDVRGRYGPLTLS